jgi:hypothetical protein
MRRRALYTSKGGEDIDISTSSMAQTSTLALTAADPKSLIITQDGTKLFLGDRAGYVRRYDFGTPYDVSTLSFVNSSGQIHSTFEGYDLNSDGTKLFSITGGTLREYTLTTPWDVSTWVFVQSEVIDSTAISPSFSRDGSKLYIFCNGAPDFISQYTLTTPWDITTLSAVSTRNFFSGASSDLRISDNGRYLFFNHNNDNLYKQSELSTPYDIQTSTIQGGLYMENTRCGHIVEQARKVYLLDYTNKKVTEYNF